MHNPTTTLSLTRIVAHAIVLAEASVSPRELFRAAIVAEPQAFADAAIAAGLDQRRLQLVLSEWAVPARRKRTEPAFTSEASQQIRAAAGEEDSAAALFTNFFVSAKDAVDPTAAVIRSLALA